MILGLYYSFSLVVFPFAKKANITENRVSLSDIKLTCTYVDTNKTCNQHVFDNFEFFKKTLFPRGQPFTYEEYQQHGESFSYTKVNLFINSSDKNIDILKLPENYTIDITNSDILITAANSFAASRAFASFSQFLDGHPRMRDNLQAYALFTGSISDFPAKAWRHVLVDAARHYLTINEIQKYIDAAAISKFNVVELNLADQNAFTIQFENYPQNKLVNGSYKYFYYKLSQIKQLKDYAFTRGVLLVPIIAMPDGAKQWRAADPNLIAKCNPANQSQIALNPINNITFQYIDGIFSELTQIFDYIHISNAADVTNCWKEDTDIQKYAQTQNITINQVYQDFIVQINKIAEKYNKNATILIFNQQFPIIHQQLKENTIIELHTNSTTQQVLQAGFKAIYIVEWFLDTSAPNGYIHFYPDSYQNIYKVDINKNVDKSLQNLIIGGGGILWGDQAWGLQGLPQFYPRAYSIINILWQLNPNKQITAIFNQGVESLFCVMDRANIDTGVIQPGKPCFGHAFK